MSKRITKALVSATKEILDREGSLTLGRIQSRMHLSCREAERLMARLKKEGLVLESGRQPEAEKKNGKYS